MATTPPQQEEIVLVRDSAEYKEYMWHQAGWLKALVNGLEDYLSISGRSLLLLFLIYTTIKAGMTIMHTDTPVWLDIAMLTLQVAGLEGSVPGLTRVRETLLGQNRIQDARTIKRAIYSSRTLSVLTGIEIVLATASIPGINPGVMAGVDDWYNKLLLVAMARMETKAPKVISRAEHEKQLQEAEQEQIRLDNESIQASIGQALKVWTSTQEQKLADWSTQLAEAVQQVHARLVDERITEAMDVFQSCLDRSAQGLQASNDQLWTVVQPLQEHLSSITSVDPVVLVSEVVAQAETRMTAAMRRLEQEVERKIRVSSAVPPTQNGTSETTSTVPHLVSLPKRSSGTLRVEQAHVERVEPMERPGGTAEIVNYKQSIYLLLNEDNTRQVADLVALTGFPKTTVWRHWNKWREDGGTDQNAEDETAS